MLSRVIVCAIAIPSFAGAACCKKDEKKPPATAAATQFLGPDDAVEPDAGKAPKILEDADLAVDDHQDDDAPHGDDSDDEGCPTKAYNFMVRNPAASIGVPVVGGGLWLAKYNGWWPCKSAGNAPGPAAQLKGLGPCVGDLVPNNLVIAGGDLQCGSIVFGLNSTDPAYAGSQKKCGDFYGRYTGLGTSGTVYHQCMTNSEGNHPNCMKNKKACAAPAAAPPAAPAVAL